MPGGMKMIYLLFIMMPVVIGGYFTFRFFLLKYALREADKELKDIQKDFTQNQILHLPAPDGDLEKLMNSFNGTLEEIRRHRWEYEKREKEFQKQIENISHDLRTPLTVILGYLKFMKSPGKNMDITQEQAEVLEIIERKAESMEKLVTQFYTFSRINAQDYELKIQEIDVCRILRETLIDNYQILETAHLKLDTDLPEHPIWVKGDDGALERIFSNLFQNVGRYANSFLRIRLKESEEETLIFFVNDTEKLSETDIPYLFDRFYMKDVSRNQGGTGLGLTVAKCLAEAMNGALDVESIDERKECDEIAEDKNIMICFTLKLKNVLLDMNCNMEESICD